MFPLARARQLTFGTAQHASLGLVLAARRRRAPARVSPLIARPSPILARPSWRRHAAGRRIGRLRAFGACRAPDVRRSRTRRAAGGSEGRGQLAAAAAERGARGVAGDAVAVRAARARGRGRRRRRHGCRGAGTGSAARRRAQRRGKRLRRPGAARPCSPCVRAAQAYRRADASAAEVRPRTPQQKRLGAAPSLGIELVQRSRCAS
jgi:hypothetical protein